MQTTLSPVLRQWGNRYLRDVSPSGSFAKGTDNRSGTDIDLFLSLTPDTPDTLAQIYNSLDTSLLQAGYHTRRQNVSINVGVGGYDVDLVPGKQQHAGSWDHSLYRRKASTWTKSNVVLHVATVINGGRMAESRVVKLWRNQTGLEFPSFYLELAVSEALRGRFGGELADRVLTVFRYLRDSITHARFIDPANTNNLISDDLTAAKKQAVSAAAGRALAASTWEEVVR